MTHDRWRKIEESYHQAMGREPVSRAAYLAQLDPDIRAEVEELLAQESQDSPLDHRSGLFGALTPGAMLGHYRIEQSIGAGGMGEVYRATDTKLRRSVAIKVCGAGFVRRFEREARAIAALNHPNICTLYESGPDYLVMELVEGPTLADRIRKSAIPINEAIDIARQIAEALEAAHEHGIIHRDLKPANIKLTSDGRVKVLDFGLAKSTAPTPPDAAAATITNTEQGLIVGTPSYMSPEQAEGLPTDKRTDIWSFGVVVWEMLTGHRLFDAQSASRILSEVLQREIDFDKLPAAISDDIRTLLRRCLDRNLKTRLRDIGEARIALVAPRTEKPRQRARIVSPATLGWIVAATMTAAFLATLAYYASRSTLPAQSQRAVFQITTPEGGLRDLEISPDGKTLLLLSGHASSMRKVWIRSLDRLETRLVTTIPGLLWFHWSPDSEFVCYQTGNHLYRISRRTAEQPTLIGNAPDSITHGLWIDQGTLILASQEGIFRLGIPNGNLTRIYDKGGWALAALTGKQFVFSRSDGVYAGQLDGRKEVRIWSGPVISQVYVPVTPESPNRGHLLVHRDGSLFLQPFDSDKLQFNGSPTPLMESPVFYSVSMTGTLLSVGGSNRWCFAWLNRKGALVSRVTTDLHLGYPIFRLSPDETRVLVFLRDAEADKIDSWIADLRNGNVSRLSFAGAFTGVWSPDGRNVLLASRNGDQSVRPADGSGSDITWPELKGFPTDWSEDGKQIVSVVRNQEGRTDLWTTSMGATGDRRPSLYLQDANASLFGGQFFPKGRWVAYGARTQIPQVLVESFPPGRGRWQISTEGGTMPAWRRDGKELFFIHGSELWAVPVRELPESLEFGKPEKLFDLPTTSNYATRDGQRFLVSFLAEQDDPMKQVITVDTDFRSALPSK